MNFGLLLLPAVGGYWFVTHFNLTRFQAIRDSGYHILFRSVLVGIFWYVAAEIAIQLLDAYNPKITEFWDGRFSEPFTSPVVLSIALGASSPYVLNLFYSSTQGARKAASNAGDHIELLITDAIRDQSPIEISLRSRKSYIGFVVGNNAGRNSDVAVALFPVYSGHRSEETLDLEIDMEYGSVVETYLNDPSDWDPEDFRVVVPISEIVSARPFDEKIYRDFQMQNLRSPSED